MNITNPRNIKDIQSKIKVITIPQEFSEIISHSMNQDRPIFKDANDINKFKIDPNTKKSILDKYIETDQITV